MASLKVLSKLNLFLERNRFYDIDYTINQYERFMINSFFIQSASFNDYLSPFKSNIQIKRRIISFSICCSLFLFNMILLLMYFNMFSINFIFLNYFHILFGQQIGRIFLLIIFMISLLAKIIKMIILSMEKEKKLTFISMVKSLLSQKESKLSCVKYNQMILSFSLLNWIIYWNLIIIVLLGFTFSLSEIVIAYINGQNLLDLFRMVNFLTISYVNLVFVFATGNSFVVTFGVTMIYIRLRFKQVNEKFIKIIKDNQDNRRRRRLNKAIKLFHIRRIKKKMIRKTIERLKNLLISLAVKEHNSICQLHKKNCQVMDICIFTCY
jgi:hypothetical protein